MESDASDQLIYVLKIVAFTCVGSQPTNVSLVSLSVGPKPTVIYSRRRVVLADAFSDAFLLRSNHFSADDAAASARAAAMGAYSHAPRVPFGFQRVGGVAFDVVPLAV